MKLLVALRNPSWPLVLRWLLGVCAALIVLVTLAPRIDIWAARLFYLGDGRFWLYRTGAGELLDDARVLIGFTTLLAVVITSLFLRWVDARAPFWTWRELAAPAATFVISVIIVVNAFFKDIWGRARPRYITEFGGADTFSGALVIPGPCDSNCSFVTGDGAFAFAFISLALLTVTNRSKFVVGSILLGLGTGMLRMMMGAHFLSDVLYSGLITICVALLIHRLIIGEDPIQALGLRLGSGRGRLPPGQEPGKSGDAGEHQAVAAREQEAAGH